jgi:hypothetical protein
MIEVSTTEEVNKTMRENATKLVGKSNWETRRPAYFRIVDNLSSGIFHPPTIV